MSTISFPTCRVGEPVRAEKLALFPLFAENESSVEYLLAEEAISNESILVEEVDESGSVPELFVENKGDTQVLFLEGEELVGAKQNRVLNTSVLVGAKSRIKVPVSCVEQGRWSYNSRQFSSSGSYSHSSLRHKLKSSVMDSLQAGEGHRSDQGEVWSEVEQMQSSHGVSSDTSALADTFEANRESVANYREKLPYVEGASGLAIVVGEKLVSMDLFDKPATCEKVWNRLLSGSVLEALISQAKEEVVASEEVQHLVESTNEMEWHTATAVGQGEEQHARGENGEQASALLYEGTIVHGSVVLN